jgi:hypothetical protein
MSFAPPPIPSLQPVLTLNALARLEICRSPLSGFSDLRLSFSANGKTHPRVARHCRKGASLSRVGWSVLLADSFHVDTTTFPLTTLVNLKSGSAGAMRDQSYFALPAVPSLNECAG